MVSVSNIVIFHFSGAIFFVNFFIFSVPVIIFSIFLLFFYFLASPSEDLWGISKIQGRLQRYERHILGISEDYVDKRRFSENIEDEWEIIL